MRRFCFLASASLALAFLSGCVARTSVGHVLHDPYHFRNHPVQLQGRVTGSLNVLVGGGYQLDDGTGRITVIANGAPPPRGSEVRVTGQVTPAVSVFGNSVGVTLREHDRKVRW